MTKQKTVNSIMPDMKVELVLSDFIATKKSLPKNLTAIVKQTTENAILLRPIKEHLSSWIPKSQIEKFTITAEYIPKDRMSAEQGEQELAELTGW